MIREAISFSISINKNCFLLKWIQGYQHKSFIFLLSIKKCQQQMYSVPMHSCIIGSQHSCKGIRWLGDNGLPIIISTPKLFLLYR